MAASTKFGNLIVDDEQEMEVIAALEFLERYCLKKRDKGECESCVIAQLADSDCPCPFHDELSLKGSPGDWEIREELYNTGMRIYKREEWEELRRKVGKA